MKKILKQIYLFFLKSLSPKVESSKYQINHYGTNYGGYDIIDNLEIKNVISCGLGEDASFDVEILNRKNCKVYMVDPTPKAIKHYEQIRNNFGSKRKFEYSNDGKQPVESYNLEKINETNFILIDKAIYNSSKKWLKLYQPLNENFVSASLNQIKNHNQKFFYAEIITLDEIIKQYKVHNIDLLKLDIEGAEVDVIHDFLKKNIYPKQLLVEFTNQRTYSLIHHLKIYFVDRKLKKNNYTLVFKNNKGDFTYLLKK